MSKSIRSQGAFEMDSGCWVYVAWCLACRAYSKFTCAGPYPTSKETVIGVSALSRFADRHEWAAQVLAARDGGKRPSTAESK